MMRSSVLMLSAVVSLLACAAPASGRAREPRTAAAVLAASDDWLAAERMGNVAQVDARLMRGYVDVGPNGLPHAKAELLNHTATRKDIWPGTAAEVARAFHEKYPSNKKVTIDGDTAILAYFSTDFRLASFILAEDIFVYRDGMWRGMMSNHFTTPKLPDDPGNGPPK